MTALVRARRAAKDAAALETLVPPTEGGAGFLAAISHELRTPLTALTGYGELLSDEILGPLSPLQQDTIDRMRAATHQLTVMIDGILAFSNLEAGAEKAVVTDVAPAAVLRDAVSVVEPIAHMKGLELMIDVPECALIRSDRDKIRQILVHLADNAIKFTDAGCIRFCVADLGNEVRFTVVDTGIGIAPEYLNQVFHPFMQVDTGLTRRHGGVGLGLYIANQLATLLGSYIEVESTSGMGSTFSLVIPRPGSH